MRTFLIIFLSVTVVLAQKGFTPEYFVKKHNLKLPEVDVGNVDVSKCTQNDSKYFFYQGKTKNIDSVYSYVTFRGVPTAKLYEKYHYQSDSILVRQTEIAQDNYDTMSKREIVIYDNYKTETRFDRKRNCKIYLKRTSWGQPMGEKSLCPGDKEPHGQEFTLTKMNDYVESIETYENKVDSSDIRRYYFSAFDSLVAQYTLSKKEDPALMNLIFYTNTHKKKIEYDFDFFKHSNEVTTFDIYTYRPDGNLFRMYLFDSKAHRPSKGGSKPPREYKLLSYVEYSYDSLGRKTSMISYDPPDAKSGK